MSFRSRLLAVFITGVLYSVQAAGFAVFAHASSACGEDIYSPEACSEKVGTKGLPAEMLISAEELRQSQLKGKRLILFDARSQTSYQQAHIKGAVLPLNSEYYKQQELFKKGAIAHLPDADAALAEATKRYPKDKPIIAYCSSGGCQASAVLVLQLKRLGFTNVKDMAEGFETWEKKGYPVSKAASNPSTSH